MTGSGDVHLIGIKRTEDTGVTFKNDKSVQFQNAIRSDLAITTKVYDTFAHVTLLLQRYFILPNRHSFLFNIDYKCRRHKVYIGSMKSSPGRSNRAPWNRGAVSNRRKISVFRLFLRDLYGLSSPISLAERVSALQTHVLWFNIVTFCKICDGFFDFATMSRFRPVTLMLTYLPSQLLTMTFIVANYSKDLGQWALPLLVDRYDGQLKRQEYEILYR